MVERVTSYAELLSALAPEREALLAHPVYAAVADARGLGVFMASHVFAVWDFMSLLKTLQQRLTCVTSPWTPPRSRVAARLINGIVLGEESDVISGLSVGANDDDAPVSMSHFELYVDAMREVGVATTSIDRLLDAIRNGARISAALEAAAAPSHVRDFVLRTFGFVDDPAVETVAAAFLIGREDLVPEMFRRLLPGVAAAKGARLPALTRYLERHIEVDEGEHGPMARKLLAELCGNDEDAWRRATEAGRLALTARRGLWDGVVASLRLSIEG